MIDIKEKVMSDKFKIINIKFDGIKSRLVTDKRGVLFAEVPKDEVSDPEEFEDCVKNRIDVFDKVIYRGKIRDDDYYLYEIYINDVEQEY